MPETRYAGDLIEHRLKYMTDFLFGLGDLGRTNLFQDRPYRFASGGAALPNGWELLFGEAISGEFSAQGPQSQEENGSCFGSETLSQNEMDYSGTDSAREAGALHALTPGGSLLESVKHLALALLRDELVEKSHHLVAPGNQRFDLVLC